LVLALFVFQTNLIGHGICDTTRLGGERPVRRHA
jgi:hypothetical protein